MAEKKAWESEKDGTVFVERDDGGREIITGPPDDRKVYQTERQDDSESDDSGADNDE